MEKDEKKEMEGTKSSDSSKKKIKEKICEIFKVGKNGEKTIKACGTEETEVVSKGQIKSENKILRNILIFLGIIVIVFLLIFLSVRAANNFEYKGINFNVVKEGDVLFYHTSFPMIYDGIKVNYNVYLRNDPRKLDKIPFEGELNLLEMMVINNSGDFVCEGKGGIAMINFQQILGDLGMNFMKDPNAGCDPEGRYMFVQIQEGNVTKIEQTGPACYNFYVKDCEILEVTEKFLVESLVELI